MHGQEIQRHDFTIKQGTTTRIGFPVVDALGEPADLTGYEVKSQIRDEKTRTLLYEFVTSTQGNLAIIAVEPDVSTDWTWKEGVYDVEITSPTGDVTRISQGKIKVNREVTL